MSRLSSYNNKCCYSEVEERGEKKRKRKIRDEEESEDGEGERI